VPDAIAVSGESPCRPASCRRRTDLRLQGRCIRQSRLEIPRAIATLIEGGKTVGRHYAGPHWELADGSIVAANAIGQAPGATAQDITQLKLEVTSHAGTAGLVT